MGRGLDGFIFRCQMRSLCSFQSSPGGGLSRFPVVMARGKHLFPFRTEQLSPSAPMVLGSQGPGRVGRRRFDYRLKAPPLWRGLRRRALARSVWRRGTTVPVLRAKDVERPAERAPRPRRPLGGWWCGSAGPTRAGPSRRPGSLRMGWSSDASRRSLAGDFVPSRSRVCAPLCRLGGWIVRLVFFECSALGCRFRPGAGVCGARGSGPRGHGGVGCRTRSSRCASGGAGVWRRTGVRRRFRSTLTTTPLTALTAPEREGLEGGEAGPADEGLLGEAGGEGGDELLGAAPGRVVDRLDVDDDGGERSDEGPGPVLELDPGERDREAALAGDGDGLQDRGSAVGGLRAVDGLDLVGGEVVPLAHASRAARAR